MRERAANNVFAHKFLILLPLLITLPLMSLLGLRPAPKQWQSVAVVWVEQPAPNYQTVDLGWTPAGNQVTFLNSLIHTSSFSQTVLQQTSLAPQLQNPVTADAAERYLWKSVAVSPIDVNFMAIKVTMTDPNLAWKTAQAILDSYQKTLTDRGQTVSGAALTSASDDLNQAQKSLVDADTQLANYLAAHPGLVPTGTSTSGGLVAAADVNLALLQQQVRDAESSYTGSRQHYLDIQAASASGQQSQSLNFNIIDKPQLPYAPVHQSLLARLQLPLIGLVLGLMLGAGIAAVLILTDHSVLTAYDVETAFNLPVLGEVRELVPGESGGPSEGVRERLAMSVRIAG